MHAPYPGQETSEAKLLNAIYELSHRILHAPEPEYRAELRSTIETLREQLVKLVNLIPVPTEIDVLEFKKAQAHLMSPRPPLMPM